ncbi:N-acetylmuramoyl-L-alanine amidase [bacterium]|nr:N-acetylmuramoyl-L-alanine amidase [bacterium]
MKTIVFFLLLSLSLLASCGGPGQSISLRGPVDRQYSRADKVCGILVRESYWHSDNPDTLEKRLEILVREMAGTPATILFLQTATQNEPVFPRAVRMVKENGCSVYAWLDLSATEKSGEHFPSRKHTLKNMVRWTVTGADIDGLHFSGDGGTASDARYRDLIEDLTAEALLVKTYLDISETTLDSSAVRIASVQDIQKVHLPGAMATVAPAHFDPDNIVSLNMDSLHVRPADIVRIEPSGREKIVDSSGWFGVILPEAADSLTLKINDLSIPLSAADWKPPFRYRVLPDCTVERVSPWVEFRNYPADTVSSGDFHLLCMSEYPARVFINDDSVKQYRTGIFFDHLQFSEGINRIRTSASASGSIPALYEREIVYKKPARRDTFPLWIGDDSLTPDVHQILCPDDYLTIRFAGSKQQNGFAVIGSRKNRIQLSRTDFDDFSMYSGEFPLGRLRENRDHTVQLVLESLVPANPRARLKKTLDYTIRVQKPQDFPLVRVTSPRAWLTYNPGQVRLGGPLISEAMGDAVLQVSGEIGDAYRVRLNRLESGMIAKADVERLPPGAGRGVYNITSLYTAPDNGWDAVTIPYLNPVPYAVYPEPFLNRIRIVLYGARTTSTWLTHKDTLQVIRRVSWQQTDPETYEVLVHLATPNIWGYRIDPGKDSLTLRVKHPPRSAADSLGTRLAGLTIGIEAGHGGSNRGAVGLSGLYEKDVNLDVALKLEHLCRDAGMNVVQVRDRDEYISLYEKRRLLTESSADLMVSIHANAGSGRGGYLRVGGASTYYHNPFWADFARIMNDSIRKLGLDDFGVVGSFNYTVIRIHSMPAILVEQAFMDHAEDEEKLASPEFRSRMAQKIFEGIAEYIRFMLE